MSNLGHWLGWGFTSRLVKDAAPADGVRPAATPETQAPPLSDFARIETIANEEKRRMATARELQGAVALQLDAAGYELLRIGADLASVIAPSREPRATIVHKLERPQRVREAEQRKKPGLAA